MTKFKSRLRVRRDRKRGMWMVVEIITGGAERVFTIGFLTRDDARAHKRSHDVFDRRDFERAA